MPKEEIIQYYRILEHTNNIMVINLPPNKDGVLVKGDVDNLLAIAKALNISRKQQN